MTKQEGRSWDKQFLAVFQLLTHRNQAWKVWSDFVDLAACAISNRVDKRQYDTREKRYMDIIAGYNPKELDGFAQLLAILTQALDDEPEQDFLGKLFMELELGGHWHGQFFTPYNICKPMAEMQIGDLALKIETNGHVSVNDPACGAGATLIAFSNVAKDRGINYQQQVLFVAQDIDQTAAMMCYLQLSLLGCPGYVIVGNTLTKPDLHPENEVWYTPMHFVDIWHWRRLFRGISDLMPSNNATQPVDLVATAEEPRIDPILVAAIEDDSPVIQLTLF